ncbi:MAG: hypothetical protein N2689_02140 [Verrucomicrobiae bacterium]|nr:hypothetical protein [Verrucomicrobiae bacterium]
MIYRVRPVNGEEETIALLRSSGIVDIGVTMDAEGTIFVAYAEASHVGVVARVNAANGTVKVITRGKFLVDPVALAPELGGNLLVVDAEGFGGAGGLVRVNSRSGLQQVVSSALHFGQPQGIALTADGFAFVADPGAVGGPGVVRVQTQGGAQAKVVSRGQLRAPVGIALAANGDLIVSDARATSGIALAGDGSMVMSETRAAERSRGVIFRINPATGAQEVACAGGDFAEPQGIAMGQADDLFVADRGAFKDRGGVIRVNLASRAQTARYPGWRYNDPRSIAIVPASQPDLQIRKPWDFGYHGDGRYSPDGKDQIRAQGAGPGGTCVFSLRLQNDGKFTDSFILHGTTRAPGFALKYSLAGGRDEPLASDVSAEGEMIHVLRDLAPGATRVIRVEITPDPQAQAGAEETFVFSATSVNDRAKRDAVRAVVQVKK